MTIDPKRRFREHRSCRVKYTKRFNGNVIMVYLERLEDRDKKNVSSMAWKREKQIKKYTRNKKAKLIKMHAIKSNTLIRKYLN